MAANLTLCYTLKSGGFNGYPLWDIETVTHPCAKTRYLIIRLHPTLFERYRMFDRLF